MKKNILTGDRPTGRLHLGHYVGSLKRRVELQNNGDYDNFYIEIADAQALSDNFANPEKVRNNLIEVILDYLSVGLDPNKVTFFVQSGVPALCELTFYYSNLVTLARLKRNPTVKAETVLRGFNEAIPAGFLTYPISQAADITGFDATIIPVGDDQLPMIEQTREIVRSFNNYYGETLLEPEAVLPERDICKRLPGTDGKNKMSKSLGNCIYLADTTEEVKKKVMSMYTDPNHINISDPGQVEGNAVFTYLDAFCEEHHITKYAPEYKDLDDLKKHYQAGGVGDVYIKKLLFNIIEEILTPIREKRHYYEANIDLVYNILKDGTKKANDACNEVLKRVKENMKINYFEDEKFIQMIKDKYEN